MPIKVKVNVIKGAVITVPPKMPVFTDKKSGAKSVAFPFQFPDGVPGYVTITRCVKLGWEPSNNIKEINVKFDD